MIKSGGGGMKWYWVLVIMLWGVSFIGMSVVAMSDRLPSFKWLQRKRKPPDEQADNQDEQKEGI